MLGGPIGTFFIATSLDDSAVSRHFQALGESLAGRGHRVLLLVDHRRLDRERDSPANPAIRTWPSWRPVHLQDARWLAGLVRRERPRAIVANFGATNLMVTIGALLGVRVRVAWYHTLLEQIRLDAPDRPRRLRLMMARKRLVYRAATHFATASDAAGDDLAQAYGVGRSRITTIGLSLRDPAGGRSGPISRTVVCVGRLDRSKGQETLVHAIPELPPDVRVRLVGDGPERGRLAAMVAELGVGDRCELAGRLAAGEVLAAMASAAVTVVPSHAEAFGLVNVESLAVGTPVVATRVGGIPEIVRDGRDGLLVPPGDAGALARAITTIVDDPQLRGRFSSAARQGYLDRFSESAVVPRQTDWLESL